jgi:hypothetical protein
VPSALVALLFRAIVASAGMACAMAAAHAQPLTARPAAGREPPLVVRVEWGGGKPRAWAGSISLTAGAAACDVVWRSLSREADAAAGVHASGPTIHVHDDRPRGTNGIEIAVADWATARLRAELHAADGGPGKPVDIAVRDLFADPVQEAIDNDGNRLTVRLAEGAGLRVDAGGEGWPAAPPVMRPADTIRLTVHPLLPTRGIAAARELVIRVRDTASGIEQPAKTLRIEPVASVPIAGQAEVQACSPVVVDVPLGDRETVWSITLEAIERGSLRWSRPLATRTVDVATVAERVEPPPAAEWRVVHELDPASPRLHERLRRLPGMPSLSLPSVPVPSIRLPPLPLPSMARSSAALQKLTNVPLPSVSAMVPRMSGLLASGHSAIEPHAFGPMLVLPPSRSADEPAWEGLVIAGVDVGMPHLVEIEYPQDQDAVFGVSVLETDDRGARVQCRHAGGFEAVRPAAAAGGGLGRHSFVFWPATKNPVVLITNASTVSRAMFGKVRVFSGPTRVPAMRVAGPPAAAVAGRGVHAFVPTPDGLACGAAGSVAAERAHLVDEWPALVRGARRSAEWLAAQGAGGAMVGVYAQGGAIWPSAHTLGVRRWLAGDGDGGKDMLGMLCRVYAGAGLALVPAVSFDAPLPALESLVAAEADATGILLVGRDGRPRRLSGPAAPQHYNILDQRVQQAVLNLVAELVGRVESAPSVTGVGILLSHDGWLHLPGVAWGLDDTTFGRFAAATGAVPPTEGGDRFARRATLVEGPRREEWLAWRAREIAAFYARLADVVGGAARKRSLYLTPTTLFARGELAARFRPSLMEAAGDDDLWREIGIDPAAITAAGNAVLLSPHVHAADDGLVDRGTVDNANRSLGLARGAAVAARRGVVAVEIPTTLAIRDMVPHGPFGSAAAEAPVAAHAVRSGPAQTRALAEAFVAADAEAIFDMSLLYAQPTLETVMARRAFAALPAQRLGLVDPLPAPLVVRSATGAAGSHVVLVNAADVPLRASLVPSGRPAIVVDAADGGSLAGEGAAVDVALGPWGVRTVVMAGGVQVSGVRVAFDDGVREWVAGRLADLRQRRAAIEQPAPVDVLDNPAFDLPQADGAITGWELVEPRRGSVAIVPDGRSKGGRALAFSSVHGLSTVRSNPFAAPAAGRISVAVGLRIAAGDPQPPLRIAVEGVENDREYYRFAPVGGLAGGRPLGAGWSQFVLQIDDLPSRGLESLRVRLDLLGPGAVQVDDVRVFDLAFDESQRVQFSRMLAMLDERMAADDLGSCVLALDSYWPRFLAAHVPVVEAPVAEGGEGAQPGGQPMARPPSTWTWR